jgi:tetraacyldisaccharide 4'-kinase
MAYQHGILKTATLPVPVVVVGNITVGGTGKTPLVIWLVEYLRRAGFRPGVISRGYGGQASDWPQWVSPDSDPQQVGDEPVMIAQRARCPVVVGPDRPEDGQTLLENADCNIVLCDDGLQHYRLQRDLEIVVVDAVRGFGNGYCLPAGPLREPVSRLDSVPVVVYSNSPSPDTCGYTLEPTVFRSLADGNATREPSDWHRQTIHAVAGIGNPERFFQLLEAMGLSIVRHAFPDHHRFTAADLDFGSDAVIVMTEKDAVKCRESAAGDLWYLAMDVKMTPVAEKQLGDHLVKLKNRRGDDNG